jgi:integrase
MSTPPDKLPLFLHKGSCQWAKKIKGKTIYFGKDQQQALERYYRERLHLEAGVNIRKLPQSIQPTSSGGMRLGEGIDLFLANCEAKATRGELSRLSVIDYKLTLGLVTASLDCSIPIEATQPLHWASVYDRIATGKNATTINGEVARVRACFNWLRKNRYIDRDPYYGEAMKRPSKSSIRIAKTKNGRSWFDRDEIHSLLKAARPSLKAMILLGVNCGLGNSDCAQLDPAWLDLKSGWLRYPRPKTGVDRRAKLWGETIKAIEDWKSVRPKVNRPLLFITRQGNPWSDPHSPDCQIAKCFRSLCLDTGLHIVGRGFYGLRRTCETIGGEAKDQVALDYLMGHIDSSMGGVYRQSISDGRLESVALVIHGWLFQ